MFDPRSTDGLSLDEIEYIHLLCENNSWLGISAQLTIETTCCAISVSGNGSQRKNNQRIKVYIRRQGEIILFYIWGFRNQYCWNWFRIVDICCCKELSHMVCIKFGMVSLSCVHPVTGFWVTSESHFYHFIPHWGNTIPTPLKTFSNTLPKVLSRFSMDKEAAPHSDFSCNYFGNPSVTLAAHRLQVLPPPTPSLPRMHTCTVN